MLQQLAGNSFVQLRRSRLGIVATLILAAMLVAAFAAVPGQVAATPRYKPCLRIAVCLYDNVNWNHRDALTGHDDDGDYIEFLQESRRPYRGRLWLNPSISRPSVSTGKSLENRVSSYANNTTRTYCVYDRRRNGSRIFLWRMLPGGSSSWVGRARNDRADFIQIC